MSFFSFLFPQLKNINGVAQEYRIYFVVFCFKKSHSFLPSIRGRVSMQWTFSDFFYPMYHSPHEFPKIAI